MAGTPQIKIYDAQNNYQASVKDYVLAAACMAILGNGATVRLGHSKKDIIYTEGINGDCGESYDSVWTHIDKGG